MLFRTHNKELIEINKNDFLCDKDYYNELLKQKLNIQFKSTKNCVENIISTVLYEEHQKKNYIK